MKKIVEPRLKVAYVKTLMKMIESPNPKTFVKCYKVLEQLDSMMKDVGLRTVITVSSEKI